MEGETDGEAVLLLGDHDWGDVFDLGGRLQCLFLHQFLLGLLLQLVHQSGRQAFEQSVLGDLWDAGELAQST
jgi:hypothetical protein